MKILIAYDGSDCADAAIEDLSRAGLPEATEALILNVTETWLPKDFENESFVKTVGWTGAENIRQMRQAAIEKVAEGEKLAGDSANQTVFYLFAAALGATCAVFFERFAFHFGLWTYSELMPVVPILETGLLPFMQLTLLVPSAIWLTKRDLKKR